jgi:hypothetical protein
MFAAEKIDESVVYGAAPMPHVLQFKLWSKVKIQDIGRYYQSCWEFTGRKNEFGHGYFSHRKQTFLAHRVAYEMATGVKLTDGQVVRHKCDNPGCCNPLHLEAGTQADNNLDMLFRGRNPKGATHGMASITPTQVREIRYLFHEAGGVRGAVRAIAKRTGVNKNIVCCVTQRKTWSDLPDNFSQLDPKPSPLTADELKTIFNQPNRGGSQLTPEKVQRIRALREAGAPLALISAKLGGVAWGALSQICSRKTWSDVPAAKMSEILTAEEIEEAKTSHDLTVHAEEQHHAALLTKQQVREMRWLAHDYLQKVSSIYGLYQAIANRYGVKKGVARQVILRTNWAQVPDDFDSLAKPPPLEKIKVSRERKKAHAAP